MADQKTILIVDDDYELSDVDGFSEATRRPWKKRVLARFGLPVAANVQDMVDVHVRHLYREARIMERAKISAYRESRRTGKTKFPSKKRLDPGVLWVLCTQGCRHSPFKVILKEPTA